MINEYVTEAMHRYPVFSDAIRFLYGNDLIARGYVDVSECIENRGIGKSELSAKLKEQNSELSCILEKRDPKNFTEMVELISPVADLAISTREEALAIARLLIVSFPMQTFERAEVVKGWLQDLIYGYKITENEVRIEHSIAYLPDRISLKTIDSIQKYIEVLAELNSQGKEKFYRGHGSTSYSLYPSVFRRENWLQSEKNMCAELRINCVTEFSAMRTGLDILAEMQHYGLPTRLLDVTTNPLVALYFACEDKKPQCGEVIVFNVDRSDIKYPQSDTVSILSHLTEFSFKEQLEFLEGNDLDKLASAVAYEKAGFSNKIRTETVENLCVVLPDKKNRRLEAQDGAFIICGLLKSRYQNLFSVQRENEIENLRMRRNDGKKYVYLVSNKAAILQGLEQLGISKKRIYPEIDDVADYIKSKYM